MELPGIWDAVAFAWRRYDGLSYNHISIYIYTISFDWWLKPCYFYVQQYPYDYDDSNLVSGLSALL